MSAKRNERLFFYCPSCHEIVKIWMLFRNLDGVIIATHKKCTVPFGEVIHKSFTGDIAKRLRTARSLAMQDKKKMAQKRTDAG